VSPNRQALELASPIRLRLEAERLSLMFAATAGGVAGPPEAVWAAVERELEPFERLDEPTLRSVLEMHLMRAEAAGEVTLRLPRPIVQVMLRTLRARLAGEPVRRGPAPRPWSERRYEHQALAALRARAADLVASGARRLDALDQAAEEVATTDLPKEMLLERLRNPGRYRVK